MKTTFTIKQVPETKFGNDIIKSIPREINRLACRNIFLILDRQMVSMKLTKTIVSLIQDCPEVNIFQYHISSPILDIQTIQACFEEVKSLEIDMVIGYGGWRCTDLAKLIGFTMGFKVLPSIPDLINTQHPHSLQQGIPVISVPTTPPNGAEIDTKVMIRDENEQTMKTIDHPFLAPRLTIVDPVIMTTIPKDLTATTAMDALFHGIDALISINSSPFSEILALHAISLIRGNIVDAFRYPENIRARYNVAWGSLLSALALNMTGSGIVHAFAYPLTARYGISHPQAASLIGIHLLKFNMEVVPDQFLRIAKLMGCELSGKEDDVYQVISDLEQLYSRMELPDRLSSYKIPGYELSILSDEVECYHEYLENNPRKLDINDIQKLYRSAF